MADAKKTAAPQDAAKDKDRALEDHMRKDSDMHTPGPSRREKDAVTEGSEESFPASDPPAFMGGAVVGGAPRSKPVETIPPPATDDDCDDEDECGD
jgi:hypothetical protein